MAERQQIQKSQRMKEALVAPVAVDFFFERFEVGEQVGVADHHAFRGGGRSRGVLQKGDVRRRDDRKRRVRHFGIGRDLIDREPVEPAEPSGDVAAPAGEQRLDFACELGGGDAAGGADGGVSGDLEPSSDPPGG